LLTPRSTLFPYTTLFRSIVSYLTWIGLIIALVTTKDRSDYTSFHIRQSLGLCLLTVLGIIPFLGIVIFLFAMVLWIIAIIGAFRSEEHTSELQSRENLVC